MHTARFRDGLAIPGGAPGYDDDKEFGNFITHIAAQTSQRLREDTSQAAKVKAIAARVHLLTLVGAILLRELF
jgi:hypothetical protein